MINAHIPKKMKRSALNYKNLIKLILFFYLTAQLYALQNIAHQMLKYH